MRLTLSLLQDCVCSAVLGKGQYWNGRYVCAIIQCLCLTHAFNDSLCTRFLSFLRTFFAQTNKWLHERVNECVPDRDNSILPPILFVFQCGGKEILQQAIPQVLQRNLPSKVSVPPLPALLSYKHIMMHYNHWCLPCRRPGLLFYHKC